MFTKQKVSVVAVALASVVMCGAAVAAQGDSTLTINATLTSACAVSAGATISFGSFSTLAAGDQVADSGATFTVACSVDMAPTIFAAGTRTITDGTNYIPFNLSLTSGAPTDSVPATLALATGLAIVQDGTVKSVPLYARLLKASFTSKPAGIYASTDMVVSVLY